MRRRCDPDDSMAPDEGLNARPRAAARLRVALWIAALVVVAFGAVHAVRKSVSELPVYTRGAARMAAGEEIYRFELKAFTYPPFFAVPFVPLTLIPESAHRLVWYATNLAALAAIIWLLWKQLSGAGLSGRSASFFWIGLALLAGRHVSAVFENQSHDLVVLVAVMLAITAFSRRAEVRGGSWIGIAAACKATPLLFLPVLASQRRIAASLALLFAAALATLLPDLVFPRADGKLWCVAWFDTFLSGLRPGKPADAEGAWSAWNMLNQNLAGTIYRLSTPIDPRAQHVIDGVTIWQPGPGMVQGVTIAAQLMVLAWLLFVTRPGLASGLADERLAFRRLGEAGAVLCGMVLLSPMSSKSHFCVLVVPCAFCLATLLQDRRNRVAWALLGIAALLGTATTKSLIGTSLGNQFLARGSVTFCTVAILLATGLLLLRRAQPAPADAQPGPNKEGAARAAP
jgi:hypothetical protein